MNEKLSRAMKKYWESDAGKQKKENYRHNLDAVHYSPSEHANEVQEIERRNKIKKSMFALCKTEDYKHKRDDGVRQKYGVQFVSQIPAVRQQRSESIKLARKMSPKYHTQEYIRASVERLNSPAALAKKVQTLLLSKQFPNYWEKQFWSIFPTLQYTGHRSFRVGKLFPDFIVPPVDKTKKLIEVFGKCYHTPEEETSRKQYLKKMGFDCLVVWVSEIKNDLNRNSLLKKVNDFIEKQS